MKNRYTVRLALVLLVQVSIMGLAHAQLPSVCAAVDSRTNGNGQANSCPNVSGTPYASNFTGTPYATVPAGAKTGDIRFRYANSTTSLLPPAITKIWQTVNGVSTQLAISVGPASVPAASGNDVLVTYCFYGTNLPTSGVLTLELSNPANGQRLRICSFDASCNSACGAVADPAGLTLPVSLSAFDVRVSGSKAMIEWTTDLESNCKGFEIERSKDGRSFSSIGFVPSAHAGGNSSIRSSYLFVDQSPLDGNSFYRLKQIDRDEKFSYSSTRSVNLKLSPYELVVNNNKVTVSFASVNAFSVQVVNFAGQVIASVKGNGSVEVANVPSGNYLIRIHRAQEQWVEKLLIR